MLKMKKPGSKADKTILKAKKVLGLGDVDIIGEGDVSLVKGP